MPADALKKMEKKADEAAAFLSGLANPLRLRILCQLAEGEKSVTELMAATDIAQTSMSQHLNKLKAEGIVSFRREHRTLFYYISHEAVGDLMAVLQTHFCPPGGKK